ncbi:helix-turn-helix transcriptional regulator [Enterococcus sp. MJM12]|uniref:Helix-turn-helix transcriptional regulator n=1 Tax=Candidatus Enterococcus myersii TaxID=2815322 RepID=A0ABS3H835_9ENTE|nr:helix-turn-helix transcriptional regulator [Enterococcus sp. MJM12]MBO0449174.1 helix-turn-helix transcriptional regulator [Enterococcus sp. MJM12]
MEISQILKENRIKRKLTQEQVAKAIFASQKSISNWERGKTFPDIDSLIRLANFYELSLDNLLLEGSAIVNEMKKKVKTYSLQKWSLLGPQLTNYLLFAMLMVIGNSKEQSLVLMSLIVAAGITNGISTLYFSKQLNDVDVHKYGNPWIKKITIFLGVLFISYCIISATLKLLSN